MILCNLILAYLSATLVVAEMFMAAPVWTDSE